MILNTNLYPIFFMQGAIMAVGASQPTVVASKDGRIGMKNQMQVTESVLWPMHTYDSHGFFGIFV